jgi:hypothetical protein
MGFARHGILGQDAAEGIRERDVFDAGRPKGHARPKRQHGLVWRQKFLTLERRAG